MCEFFNKWLQKYEVWQIVILISSCDFIYEYIILFYLSSSRVRIPWDWHRSSGGTWDWIRILVVRIPCRTVHLEQVPMSIIWKCKSSIKKDKRRILNKFCFVITSTWCIEKVESKFKQSNCFFGFLRSLGSGFMQMKSRIQIRINWHGSATLLKSVKNKIFRLAGIL